MHLSHRRGTDCSGEGNSLFPKYYSEFLYWKGGAGGKPTGPAPSRATWPSGEAWLRQGGYGWSWERSFDFGPTWAVEMPFYFRSGSPPGWNGEAPRQRGARGGWARGRGGARVYVSRLTSGSSMRLQGQGPSRGGGPPQELPERPDASRPTTGGTSEGKGGDESCPAVAPIH